MKPISATDNSIPPWYNQSEATPILSAITSFAKGLGHAWKLGVSEATYEHQADGNGAAFMPSGNLVSARDFAKNIFLASLPEADQQSLRAQVYLHSFQYQETVYDAGDAIKTAYFPIDCVITELAIMTDGTTVETGLYGREGVVGFTAVLGDSCSSDFKRTLIPGMALATGVDTLQQLFSERGQTYRMLLEYYQTRIKHASRRAVCNARHNLHERLCTWLLMLSDRMQSDDIPLTQESVARQLGVRRAGINEMMTALGRSGAIGRSRGRISLVERRVLEEMACACYRGYRTEVDERIISAGHQSNSQPAPPTNPRPA